MPEEQGKFTFRNRLPGKRSEIPEFKPGLPADKIPKSDEAPAPDEEQERNGDNDKHGHK